jgi:hypothetical protein
MVIVHVGRVRSDQSVDWRRSNPEHLCGAMKKSSLIIVDAWREIQKLLTVYRPAGTGGNAIYLADHKSQILRHASQWLVLHQVGDAR